MEGCGSGTTQCHTYPWEGSGPSGRGQAGSGVLGVNLGLRTMSWKEVGLEVSLGWGGAFYSVSGSES